VPRGKAGHEAARIGYTKSLDFRLFLGLINPVKRPFWASPHIIVFESLQLRINLYWKHSGKLWIINKNNFLWLPEQPFRHSTHWNNKLFYSKIEAICQKSKKKWILAESIIFNMPFLNHQYSSNNFVFPFHHCNCNPGHSWMLYLNCLAPKFASTVTFRFSWTHGYRFEPAVWTIGNCFPAIL
jgi:hypothetical protein